MGVFERTEYSRWLVMGSGQGVWGPRERVASMGEGDRRLGLMPSQTCVVPIPPGCSSSIPRLFARS